MVFVILCIDSLGFEISVSRFFLDRKFQVCIPEDKKIKKALVSTYPRIIIRELVLTKASKCLAAAKPSPPLLPGPQTIRTRLSLLVPSDTP